MASRMGHKLYKSKTTKLIDCRNYCFAFSWACLQCQVEVFDPNPKSDVKLLQSMMDQCPKCALILCVHNLPVEESITKIFDEQVAEPNTNYFFCVHCGTLNDQAANQSYFESVGNFAISRIWHSGDAPDTSKSSSTQPGCKFAAVITYPHIGEMVTRSGEVLYMPPPGGFASNRDFLKRVAKFRKKAACSLNVKGTYQSSSASSAFSLSLPAQKSSYN